MSRKELSMERRYELRLDDLLANAEVPPAVLRGVLPRLEQFLHPFTGPLQRQEQRGAKNVSGTSVFTKSMSVVGCIMTVPQTIAKGKTTEAVFAPGGPRANQY
jgi:hypothetical protein